MTPIRAGESIFYAQRVNVLCDLADIWHVPRPPTHVVKSLLESYVRQTGEYLAPIRAMGWARSSWTRDWGLKVSVMVVHEASCGLRSSTGMRPDQSAVCLLFTAPGDL
jgi:hypothetical protein